MSYTCYYPIIDSCREGEFIRIAGKYGCSFYETRRNLVEIYYELLGEEENIKLALEEIGRLPCTEDHMRRKQETADWYTERGW